MRLMMFFLLWGTTAQVAPDNLELAKAAATAYEANRSRFTTWTIEFDYTVAQATSLEDALAGRWTDSAVSHGFCAYDGKRGRYDLVHSLEDMASKRVQLEKGHYQSHLRSNRYLTDGDSTLIDHITVNARGSDLRHVVQILPGTQLFRQSMLLPLGIGQGELAIKGLPEQVRLVESPDSGRTMTVHEDIDLRGAKVVEFAFAGPDDNAVVRSFWIDLEHGAIPRQTLAVLPTPKGFDRNYKMLEDIRDTGDGRWLPYRQLDFYEAQGLIHERVITRASFSPPSDPGVWQIFLAIGLGFPETYR